MVEDEVVLTQSRGRVAIARPVETRLRNVAAVAGAAAVTASILGFVVWRPAVTGFPDAALFFICAAAATAGMIFLSFALWGGEWVVSFEAASGTVRQELRTFGNLAVVDGFVFEELSGLCAVRDLSDSGDESYRLFMLEAENGRPLHLGDFGDEATMRAAAQAINTVHPGLRVG